MPPSRLPFRGVHGPTTLLCAPFSQRECVYIPLPCCKSANAPPLESDAFLCSLRPVLNRRARPPLLPCPALQVTPTNVDIATVAPKYHIYTAAEVEALMGRL